MAQRDIVVVGASTGGVEALQRFAVMLPGDLPAAVLVVLHVHESHESQLAYLMSRGAAFRFEHARDGEGIVPGRGYVAVPGRHLMVESGRIRLARGPRECRARPSVDVLFPSAAYEYGPRVIGIVLTGELDDGTAGLWAIKDRGGIAIVQSPEEAVSPSMPKSAIRHVAVDHKLRIEEMAAMLGRLTREEVAAVETDHARRSIMENEIRMARGLKARNFAALGPQSPYSCPQCHGSMVQISEGSIRRYRCHTGHAFSESSMDHEQAHAMESSLAQSLAILEEREMLLREIAARARDSAEQEAAERHGAKADELAQLGSRLRELLRETETSRQAYTGHSPHGGGTS